MMVFVVGTQLVSRGVAIEFEICTNSASVKELQILQSKNTNIFLLFL